MEEEPALVDTFFFARFFLGGFLLLDRVFRHYTPNRKNGVLLVLFPLLLSGGLVWGHAELLNWWFSESLITWKCWNQAFSTGGCSLE